MSGMTMSSMTMSSMAMTSPMMMMVMTAAMMVAMMLPSIAPNLWHCHRHLRDMRVPYASRRIMLFVAGYAAVWAAIGVGFRAIGLELSSTFAPSVVATIVACAGALQRSRWKGGRLLRCHDACVATRSIGVADALRDGWRLGLDCSLSCVAPMAVLFVAGLDNVPVMLIVTAVIVAERLAPAGARIARLTGTIAMAAGLMLLLA
jgi:predicted metal-binding membrane protein